VLDRYLKANARERQQSWQILFLSLIPAGLLGAAGVAHLEKTIETIANPRISLANLQGQVVVRGWDKSQVHATWVGLSPRVELDTEVLPHKGPAEKVHFSTHVLDPLVSGKDCAADYTLDVPVNSSLEIRSPQGSVQIEKLQGDASVESVGGTISVTDVAGHLSVRSVGGNIEVIRPSGRVEAYSITGNLHFVSPTSSKLRGSTTSGKITYEGDFAPGGDYTLSAYSGDMEILCPPSASFELNAKSVRGRLENAVAITPRRHAPSPPATGYSLLGTHNTGEATVELTSYSGTIRIRQQH